MEVTTSGTWFSHAGTFGTIGLIGALICAILAIVFLIKQYKGQAKAAKMTRIFLVLGLIFLLVARFAPQEEMALSHMQELSENSVEQSLEHEIETFTEKLTEEARQLFGMADEDMHTLADNVTGTLDAVIAEDNQELQNFEDEFTSEMHEDEAELDAGIHGGIEAETDQAIDEIASEVDMSADMDSDEQHGTAGDTLIYESSYIESGPDGMEAKALIAMRENALNAAKNVHGVHSAAWNESMLPDLQLDVVANVTPESAIPLMNTLCTTLTDNTIQPSTVSVRDLEGGHIARQMCGTLVQGVD